MRILRLTSICPRTSTHLLNTTTLNRSKTLTRIRSESWVFNHPRIKQWTMPTLLKKSSRVSSVVEELNTCKSIHQQFKHIRSVSVDLQNSSFVSVFCLNPP